MTAGDKLRKASVKRQILELTATGDFRIGKILAVQKRVQSLFPEPIREPDHILVIMQEIGEHLREIEPMFKDWHKEGDAEIEDIDWDAAKEELADVLILQARALVMQPEYDAEQSNPYMLADLLDSDVYMYVDVKNPPTLGQLLLSSVVPFLSPNAAFNERCSSLYYTAQYASLMPFGVSGLREAWVSKIAGKVVDRKYRSQGG